MRLVEVQTLNRELEPQIEGQHPVQIHQYEDGVVESSLEEVEPAGHVFLQGHCEAAKTSEMSGQSRIPLAVLARMPQ